MKHFIDARDEKRYSFFKGELSGIWKRADVSRKRFMVYGGLATLAWMAGVAHLTPIQKTRTLWPHALMLVLASSIAGTVGCGVKKAEQAKEGSLKLLKNLGRCRTKDELDTITPTANTFIKYFEQYSEYGRS